MSVTLWNISTHHQLIVDDHLADDGVDCGDGQLEHVSKLLQLVRLEDAPVRE